MTKKVLAILALIAGAFLVALGISFAEDKLSLQLGASLSFVSTVVLIAVTWIYVRATRDMVTVQQDTHRLQLRQSHFAAVSALWAYSFEITSTLAEASGLASELGKKKVADRNLQAQKLTGLAGSLTDHAVKLIGLAVDAENEIENHAAELGSELIRASDMFLRASDSILTELEATLKSGATFSLANVHVNWDDPKLHGEKPLVGWHDFIDGSFMETLHDARGLFAQTCRTAARERAVAANR